MADTRKESRYLGLQWGFIDGDDRLTKLPNPRADITKADILDAANYFANNNLIVGDKTSAAISLTEPLKQAYIEEQTTIKIDMTTI